MKTIDKLLIRYDAESYYFEDDVKLIAEKISKKYNDRGKKEIIEKIINDVKSREKYVRTSV